MASIESGRGPVPHEGRPGRPADIDLTWQDRDALRRELARIFHDASQARLLVGTVVPEEFLPEWPANGTAHDWWTSVFQQFDYGITEQPFRRLLNEVLHRYTGNNLLLDLRDRYLTPPAEPAAGAPAGTDGWRVIIRADSEEDRHRAASTLASLRLQPAENWAAGHAVSYQIQVTSVEATRRALDNTGLGWTLVQPGEPDQLLSELFVQGPDGSRFRVTDAPVMETIRNVVLDVLQEYQRPETPGGAVPAVANLVGADGEHQRLDMDDTLRDAGIGDGDSLAVGFEGRAGMIDPLLHQDALDRTYHDILAYAAAHTNVVVRANRPRRATEYEIDFLQRSFGPPDSGGDPLPIERHTLLIQLSPEFPIKPPGVYWLTPIFHPNVFPNYDSPQALEHPDGRGLVCLGMFAESWTPGTRFGDVLQLLVEMAGFRNYELFDFGGNDDVGAPMQPRANYFDRAAADWVLGHQAEIVAIGGSPIFPSRDAERPYRNAVARLGADVDVHAG